MISPLSEISRILLSILFLFFSRLNFLVPCATSFPTTMKAALAFAGLAQVGAMCCKTCKAPEVRWYSVDNKHGHCGESCMDPKDFWVYKPFEPNLTIADGSTGYSSCADLGWPVYLETATHGVWPVRITVDLYNHNAADAVV